MNRSMINWSVLAVVVVLVVCPSCKKSKTVSSQAPAEPVAPTKAIPVEKKAPVEQKVEKKSPALSTEEADKKKAEEANQKNVPTDPGAPESDPKVKPEDQAIIIADVGVKKVRFKGHDKPLDALIGMDIMDLAGPLGIELGEAQAKTKGTFSYDGHEFNYTKGKLTMMTLALIKIPGGLQDSRVVIPHRAGIASVKSLIDSCGEIAKAGEVSTLKCHKGKTVVTHDAKNGVRITIGQ